MPEYKFEEYQYGHLTDTKYYNDYDSARKSYYKYYNSDSCACVVYFNGRKLSFNEAYRHFEIAELRVKNFYIG